MWGSLNSPKKKVEAPLKQSRNIFQQTTTFIKIRLIQKDKKNFEVGDLVIVYLHK